MLIPVLTDLGTVGVPPIGLVDLRQAVELRRQIDREEVRLVAQLRAVGTSWGDIGGRLGVSGQAAHKRFAVKRI